LALDSFALYMTHRGNARNDVDGYALSSLPPRSVFHALER